MVIYAQQESILSPQKIILGRILRIYRNIIQYPSAEVCANIAICLSLTARCFNDMWDTTKVYYLAINCLDAFYCDGEACATLATSLAYAGYVFYNTSCDGTSGYNYFAIDRNIAANHKV